MYEAFNWFDLQGDLYVQGFVLDFEGWVGQVFLLCLCLLVLC